ncbi:Branched-chain-amino-acid aminotransferase [Smittium mucronatum]|uniref:Branched-chain-amino-acid aminotransferase n=1 Tax=Smittium mucronatum TaxID=133383 RepID=A0A1R0H1Y8_9FUNG|nr:Branched-chain-amino-acid aminotransferase [Smittium mucronatum]
MLRSFGLNKLLGLSRSIRPSLSLSASYSTGKKDTFYFKDLEVTHSTTQKALVPKEQLKFGHGFTDHMLEVEWTRTGGWGTPRIVPFHNLSLSPAASVLHYSLECFEGSKAYRGDDGKIRLFRLEDNMKRMNASSSYLALPEFDTKEAAKCIQELVRIDNRFVPEGLGYSLYLRPTMIATEDALGVSESNSALFYTIANPTGPYFPTGFKAVKLYADTEHVRAWPGGTGNKKLGANYCGGTTPTLLAKEKGYSQILWLFGPQHNITEAGTMNAFIFWINEQGVLELLTPKLDGTILPGITRDSILKMARKWGEFQVTEGSINMEQVLQASREGRIKEFFGAGTACVISPVKEIGYAGNDIHIPLDINDPSSETGPLAKRIYNEIMNIQYGNTPSEWTTVVE